MAGPLTLLWWMAANAFVLGPVAGLVLAGSGRIPGDPLTAAATASALTGAFILLLEVVLVLIGAMSWGPRQRAVLRTFLEQTLAAR